MNYERSTNEIIGERVLETWRELFIRHGKEFDICMCYKFALLFEREKLNKLQSGELENDINEIVCFLDSKYENKNGN